MAALTGKQRDKLEKSQFAVPSQRAYPIDTRARAINALARSSGKSEEAAVKRAVYKKYPDLNPRNK